jgi:hypothetical protein
MLTNDSMGRCRAQEETCMNDRALQPWRQKH